MRKNRAACLPDDMGHFGPFGGRYVAETLMSALIELEKAYKAAKRDPAFRRELDAQLRDYAGRPTPVYFAQRLTEKGGGARIFLKREDLAHTGSHKINNTLGQGLLAMRMGKRRIIAETGRGSTVWRRPPFAPGWAFPARFIWARRMFAARRSTSSGCGFWAPVSLRWLPEAGR